MTDSADIKLVPLATATIAAGDRFKIDDGPFGNRVIAGIRTGRWEGDRLRGTIVGPGADWAIATFIALGLVGGLAAGPIMSLPAAMMQPHNRAFGMGVFFTIYYLCIFAGPVVAGTLAETFGNAGVTFSFGAALLVFCGLCLAAFRRLEQRPAALAAASQ